MPKFLTFKSPSSSDLKENPLKALWESFQSLDQFTKGFLMVILLFIFATPFIVNNLQIFKPHAQEPTLGDHVPPTPPIPPSIPDEIVIKFKAGVDEKVKDNIREAHGIQKQDEITQIGVERGKVPEKAKDKIIEALNKNPRIEYAEANYLRQAQVIPNDPAFPNQYAPTRISAPVAWDISTGSSSAIIAILDTGVDLNHEDLIGKVSGTQDDNGHGTQVAGLAGAATNNAKGVAGVCWLCPLLSVKVLNSTGSGSDDSVANGITYAADHGAKAINLSLGSYSFSQTMQNAINYAWSKGVVIVGASGNDGLTSPMYPAAMDNVISVGATGTSDTRSSISNYGPWLDVVAPGVSVTTTRMGNLYGAVGGTSMAAPHVAGLAGLIFSANPNLTNQQVVDIITSTADDLGATGKDDYFGYGRINLSKALSKAVGTTPPPVDTIPPAISITFPTNGSTVSGLVEVSASATDNIGISEIQFQLIGKYVIDDTLPYSALWDTTTVANGSHILAATALDPSGNKTTATVTVNVQNSTSPDITPPTTSITSPTDGSTISGNTNIVASATDNVALSTISIFIDGNVVTSCSVSGTSSNCSYALDTTQYLNGSHTIQSKALDSSANLGTSSTITVTVTNSTATPTPTQGVSTPTPTPTKIPVSSDTIPPTVTITNPLNGSTVAKGSYVTITAQASDNIGVTKVEFYISGSLTPKCTDTTTPYTCSSWKVPSKTNATYTLTSKAYDAANNPPGISSVVVTGR